MKNKSLLDSIKSPLPCSMDWNDMTGDARVRFCAGCAKNVYNLSAMTRREATKFVARNSGKVCVRYVRGANGAVETADSKFHQITRRAPLIAAGALGVMLAVSAGAQTPATPQQTESTQTTGTKKRNNSRTSQISFTVYGASREGIPNAEIKLTNRKTKQEFVLLTNSAGIVQFSLLPRGDYDVKVSADGFKGFGRPLQIKEAVEPNLEIYLSVGEMFVGVVVDTWSEVPLFTSIAQEDNDDVKRMIVSGFNVNTKDQKGQTALHIAVMYANLEIIRFLLERGADVNAKNKEKMTPIWLIEEEDSALEISKLLIEKGADVNVPNEQKETLLMIACENDNLELVKILLEAGAKPNLKDEDDETAIEKTDSEEIRQLLKRYGAKAR